MKLFSTRVWGFDPTKWPVITFNADGYRQNLLNESDVGDRIIFVATKNANADEADQGRILGMAEIGRVPVDTLAILDREDTEAGNWEPYGDRTGTFKWPKALLMTKAWEAIDKPLLTEVMPQLNYSATYSAVEILSPYKEAVLKINWRSHPLPENEIRKRLSKLDDQFAARKTRPGPPPSSWSGEVTRDTSVQAYTYVLRYGKHDLWKVGRAIDPKARCYEINTHVPVEITGEAWKLEYTAKWPNLDRAHEIEQEIHKLLDKFGVGFERFRCSKRDLEDAWFKGIGVRP